MLRRIADLTDSEDESDPPTKDAVRDGPPSQDAVRDLRAAEFFAGSCNLTRALRDVGVACESYDLKLSRAHDFFNTDKVQLMLSEVLNHGITYAHFAPPCNSFSMARFPKLRPGNRFKFQLACSAAGI